MFVGGPDPRKNLETVVSALGRIGGNDPALVIAGGYPDRWRRRVARMATGADGRVAGAAVGGIAARTRGSLVFRGGAIGPAGRAARSAWPCIAARRATSACLAAAKACSRARASACS